MKKDKLLTAVIILFLSKSAFSQSVVDPLLNKLVEKGVIESYEAQEVRNEVSNIVKNKLDEEKKKEEDKKKEDTYKLKTLGYLQIMYTIDDTKKGKDPLYIKRARVTFARALTDWANFSLTPDFAKIAEDKNVEFKGVYIDIKPYEFLSFRAGQFNQPFGFENTYSSSKKKFPDDTPKYLSNVLSTDYDYGLMYFGNLLGFNKDLFKWQIAMLNGTTKATEDNDKKDISAKFTTEFIKGLELGVSAYQRYLGTSTITSGNHYAAYVKYEVEKPIPIFFTAEYVFGKDKNLEHNIVDLIGTLEIRPIEPILKGFALAARYELWDKNTDISNNEENITTVGINYYIDKNVRFLVDYRIVNETPSVDNNKLNFMLQVNF